MQAKELEALHHAALDPWQQGTETCFPSFPEGSFAVLCQAAMLRGAVLPQRVEA